MNPDDIKNRIPEQLYESLKKSSITELRPAQEKAIENGLLDGRNLLICTPTASGKTLIAELAGIKSIFEKRGKMIYIVPLKALASEKYKEFKEKYPELRVALSIGDLDKNEAYLAEYDIILTTSEKLDSLLRHHAPWIKEIATVIVDEVHLLNDPSRGPTLEVILTILKTIIPTSQIIALSATIGNPKALAEWLEARLVVDNWRPVKLKKGIYYAGEIEFDE